MAHCLLLYKGSMYMKAASMPTYQALEQALSKTKLKLNPSQVQGIICGILCGPADYSTSAWENLVTGGKESAEAHHLLQNLYEATEIELNEFLFDLQLVLPDDEENLTLRAEALTLWCQGVLTGLKLVQIPIEARPKGDVTEAINDLIEIAKMNYEEVVANEEDEAAYTELVEFVRMAVILIYQSMHENDQTPNSNKLDKHLH